MDALTDAPMTLPRAQELAAWRYPAPYECYDFPAWSDMQAQEWAITRPERHQEFRAVMRGQSLAGWYWLRRHDGQIILSLGLHPDECGHGAGAQLMDLVHATSESTFPGETVTLTVRPFNERARRTYARAGFVEDPQSVGVHDAGASDRQITMRRAQA